MFPGGRSWAAWGRAPWSWPAPWERCSPSLRLSTQKDVFILAVGAAAVGLLAVVAMTAATEWSIVGAPAQQSVRIRLASQHSRDVPSHLLTCVAVPRSSSDK